MGSTSAAARGATQFKLHTIGRKNWLFIGEADAGQRSAIIYTLIESCRRRGIDPHAYLRDVLTRLSEGIGESVPYACQDWANTKAAYRFFSNAEVGEEQIMAGHFQATRNRLSQASPKILMLHDTCEFSFQRDKDSKIGLLGRPSCGKGKDGRIKFITVRGILMHSSLAITLEGLPLGLAAIKFWSRKQFKGCNALKRKINPTRVPIAGKESFRWRENLRQSTALTSHPRKCVHIGDRESDIYDACWMNWLKQSRAPPPKRRLSQTIL